MKLSKLLSEEQILLDMKAAAHWPAIIELVDVLVACGKLDFGLRATVLEALKAREDQVSTGIGGGVAIPHTFSDAIDEVVAVFGRSKVGLDFEALDEAPVHLIVLFIVPSRDYHLHLRTLAAIAKMFSNREICKRLSGAATREEMLAILDPKTLRAPAPAPEPSY